MKLPELILLYLLVGGGCAFAVWMKRTDGARAVDAMLLAGFWPLYGPFLLLGNPPASAKVEEEMEFLGVLKRASLTPLGKLLPDEATARALAERLRIAAGKVDEIDRLLAKREFSEDAALERVQELTAKGASPRAIATASQRAQNVRRLRGLRDRFARELDEVKELLAQLVTQAEVVRLAGEADAESAQLVRELVCRVEGLDEMFDGDLGLLDS